MPIHQQDLNRLLCCDIVRCNLIDTCAFSGTKVTLNATNCHLFLIMRFVRITLPAHYEYKNMPGGGVLRRDRSWHSTCRVARHKGESVTGSNVGQMSVVHSNTANEPSDWGLIHVKTIWEQWESQRIYMICWHSGCTLNRFMRIGPIYVWRMHWNVCRVSQWNWCLLTNFPVAAQTRNTNPNELWVLYDTSACLMTFFVVSCIICCLCASIYGYD